MLSHHVSQLSEQLWRSPVFGDAFHAVPSTAHHDLHHQVQQMYPQVLTTLRDVLAPVLADPDELTTTLQQITPKPTAFCAATAISDSANWSAVRGVVVIMALIYWADQCMDRGDELMVQAVQTLGTARAVHPRPAVLPALVRRITALRTIEHEIERLSRPDDCALLQQCAIQETLHQEAWMWRLNRHYRRHPSARFWVAPVGYWRCCWH